MKKLCTICARGGSKGVPGKNLKALLGRPLLAHTIEHARAAGIFEAVAVSSDSEQILDQAERCDVDHVIERPAELATDQAGKVPAIQHALLEVERVRGEKFDILVDLDATNPLRLAEDIVGAVELLETTGATNVITGCHARRSPYFSLVERANDGTVHLSKTADPPILRRQDSPICYDMNGSIYVWRTGPFRESPALFNDDTRLFEMPEERSVDIDSALDFEIVEMLLRRRQASESRS